MQAEMRILLDYVHVASVEKFPASTASPRGEDAGNGAAGMGQ
jgi:hypothetical protein